MNQPYVYIYPLPLRSPCHSPSHPLVITKHRAELAVLSPALPTSFLFHTRWGVCMSFALPSLSHLFLPQPCVYKSLSMSISLFLPQTDSSGPFYLSVLSSSQIYVTVVPMVNKLDIWKLLRDVFKVLMTRIILHGMCGDGYWLAAVIISQYMHTANRHVVQWKHIICQLSPFLKICDDLQQLVHGLKQLLWEPSAPTSLSVSPGRV